MGFQPVSYAAVGPGKNLPVFFLERECEEKGPLPVGKRNKGRLAEQESKLLAEDFDEIVVLLPAEVFQSIDDDFPFGEDIEITETRSVYGDEKNQREQDEELLHRVSCRANYHDECAIRLHALFQCSIDKFVNAAVHD